MKKLVIGLLAHVDAGKTTLSEALLYQSGTLRKLGRVDHQNAFLDTDEIERRRGITIFSKIARLQTDSLSLTLLDTPGHADFSSEMERTLQVLDAAILVISGTDGIQGHTLTLLNLLEHWKIPTFLFVNKMDLPGSDRSSVLEQLQQWNPGVLDATDTDSHFEEQAALLSEALLSVFLDQGHLSDSDISEAVQQRILFPCIFGSALRLENTEKIFELLERWMPEPSYPEPFGARVFKISRGSQGERLTHLKVTGGSLHVKKTVADSEKTWEEKVDQIRIYSGDKYELSEEAVAGTICTVTGLTQTFSGCGLGFEPHAETPLLEPVLSYQVIPEEGEDPHMLYLSLLPLSEEDPTLHLNWNEFLQEIHLELMGPVQLEILSEKIKTRFQRTVSFGSGSILYRETISAPVEGIGHFEPLRHYAEVHLLLEPAPRGSGLHFGTSCSEDVLDRNWQRLVLTHLHERIYRGVLTGSPITDISISLLSGRAHEKHTEGGDFRQATYRAVRQGLMQAESVLLEPYYSFRLDIPSENVGRALSDLSAMNAHHEAPLLQGNRAIISGRAPVSQMRNYHSDVASFTHGEGHLFCIPDGYDICNEPDEIIKSIGYVPEQDLEQTPDSVFCSHGAGFNVPWDQVDSYMHLPRSYQPAAPEKEDPDSADILLPERVAKREHRSSLEQDKELLAIYEQTYGKIRRKDPFQIYEKKTSPKQNEKVEIPNAVSQPEYLLVDGYNIIYAWEELQSLARSNLDAARSVLTEALINYQAFRKNEVILVFDAYKIKGGTEHTEKVGGIYVVYTREAETADSYIERTTLELSRKNRYRVKVATSDGPEQMIILGHGALRMTPSSLWEEIRLTKQQIDQILSSTNRHLPNPVLKDLLSNGNPD